jgi:N-acetylmuramoyl-L-alanine amidase
MNDSAAIAGHISKQVIRRIKMQNRGVKQAGFYVLRGTSMPAILIETGFITHPKEEGLLRSTRYHQKLIETVYAGLLDYEKRKIQTRLAQSSAGGN